MAKTRTFIAVEATDSVHVQALQAIDRLQPLAGNVKWVEPENLHWTLQFLGDLRDEELAEVCRRVGKTVTRSEPFTITAKGIGAFPRIDRPRTLWLGVDEGSEEFCNLQARIEQDLESLGFRGERRAFVPHLTLGRGGTGSGDPQPLVNALEKLLDYKGGQMEVEEVIVFSSESRRSGPLYLPLAHFKLGV